MAHPMDELLRFGPMKNITITLDDRTAAQARVEAARKNMSLSRYIGEIVQTRLLNTTEYQEAMRSYFARGPFLQWLKAPGEKYPKREELYDRPRKLR
jgi:hypothetical protein